MKQNKELDQILQEALSPDKEPDEWLNQKILRRAKETKYMDKKLRRAKETKYMDKKLRRRIPVAAFATALVLSVGSMSAFAAWHYLTPDKVAEVVNEPGLIEAFKSKDAITINESQTYGDLKVTLLGIVSGKNLRKYVIEEELDEGKTYVVTALEKVDGTPIDLETQLYVDVASMNLKTQFDVNVCPLVKGLTPQQQYDVFTRGGLSTIENEIEYRITECDNVEIFADRGLYISVSDTDDTDDFSDAYQYNEKTGEFTRNESYEGINALFDLPIDKSKADPEAAEKYFFAEKIAAWNGKEVEKNADLLEELTQILTPDKDGIVHFSAYKLGSGKMGKGSFSVKDYFEGKKVGETIVNSVINGNNEHIGDTNYDVYYMDTFTLNEDGTVTLKVYYYNPN